MADEAKWYVLHTYSGYENKVATSIEKIVENRNLHDLIREVRIPMEKVVELRDNEQVEIERKLFPGYVLIHMVNNDDTWILVRGVRGVTGFVGPDGEPTALTDEEMASRQEAALEILYDFNQSRPFTPTGDAIPTLDITFTPTLT